MIRMTVEQLIRATGAELICGSPDATFEGVSLDSRTVPAGGAFVAFAGETVDGNRFAASALDGGASVVVLTAAATPEALEATDRTGGVLVRAANDDGESFMLDLATAWRELNPQWVIAGVTGSVGKTTTKEMLAAAVGATKRTHATKGNFNNLLGVPLTLFAAPQDAEVLVVEMGMNHAGELARIARAVRPDVCVITNVGTSHIGNLGSREAIARAKAEVIAPMRGTQDVRPTLVLTDADDYSDFVQTEFARPAGVNVLRVGTRDGLAVQARNVRLDENGLPSFEAVLEDGTTLAGTLRMPGRAMVADALSALGAAHALGVEIEPAFAAICALEATNMRLNVRQVGESPRVIDDSYNASPSSMAAALDVLASMKCEGRRIVVLGEMGELGDDSERLHALVGCYAAAKDPDLLVLIGTGDARAMADAARTMGFSEDHLETFATTQDAARVIVPVLTADDLVLVKASRAAGLDRFVKEVLAS